MGRSSTLGQLLNKLAAISPMPSDEALLADEGDLADRYDTLIEEISHHLSANTPDAAEEAEVVRVLADSFGLGGGMGVYWGRCTSLSGVLQASPLPSSKTGPSMDSLGVVGGAAFSLDDAATSTTCHSSWRC
jgi:hypothetical protein